MALIISDTLLAMGLWFFYLKVLYAKTKKPLLAAVKKQVTFKLHRKDSGTA
jgi:hypothetical protein